MRSKDRTFPPPPPKMIIERPSSPSPTRSNYAALVDDPYPPDADYTPPSRSRNIESP